jgi:hypothetical protein
MLASSLKVYPFYERLTLFLAPLLIILIAKGLDKCMSSLFSFKKWRYLLVALVLIGPTVSSAEQMYDTRLFGELKYGTQRDAFTYINDRYKEGDAVYLYWNIKYAYPYYKDSYKLKYNAIIGSDFRPHVKNEVEYLKKLTLEIASLKKYKRVWFMHEKHYFLDIGDFEGQPTWFYKNYPLMKSVKKMYMKLGKPIDSFETKQLDLLLVEIP